MWRQMKVKHKLDTKIKKSQKNGQKSDYIVFLNSGGGGMSGEYELNKIFAAFGWRKEELEKWREKDS